MINHWKNYTKSILFIVSLLHTVMIEGANSSQSKFIANSNIKMKESLGDCVHIQTKPFASLGIPEHLFKGMPARNQKQNLLINGKDRREQITELSLPIRLNKKENITRYIVQLYMTFEGEPYTGTGTIIDIHQGKCWILTAAHNLTTYSKKYGEKLQAENVYFTFAGEQHKYPCGNYFIHSTYNAENGTGKDIAFLASSTCKITMPTVFPLLQCVQKNKHWGYVIGYPGEKKQGELWGMQHDVIVNEKDEIIYTIDTTAGQSGSPILCLINDAYYIIGVHTNGGTDCNYGIKITEEVLAWALFPSEDSVLDSSKNRPNIKIPKNFMQLRWSASPYECAVLSKHVYHHGIQEGQQVSIKLDNEKQARHFPDWKVYQTLLPQYRGYKAAIYHNPTKRQMVLAYRGLQVPFESDGLSDWTHMIQGIVYNRRGYQEKDIPSLFESLQEAVFSQKEGQKYSCTIIGYGMAGWLAQITLPIAYEYAQTNPNVYHMPNPIKVVTFDSFGTQKAMLSMLEDSNKETIISQFDITNYYSSPNWVNSVYSSPGSRYRVVFKAFNTDSIYKHTLQSHTIDRFIESFDPQSGYPIRCVLIKKWPTSRKEYSNFLKFIAKYKLPYLDTSILSAQQQYDKNHIAKINYKTNSHDHSLLHERHIPNYLKKWLSQVCSSSSFFFLKEYLAPCEEQNGFWRTQTLFDAHYVVDALRTFHSQKSIEKLIYFRKVKESGKIKQQHQKTIHNLAEIGQNVNLISRIQDLSNIELLFDTNYLARIYCQYQYLSPDITFCITQYLGQRNSCIIHGHPGMGKSTLALLYAHKHLKKQTYQQIWRINFTTLHDNVHAIIRILKENEYDRFKSTILQKQRYIKKKLENDLSHWLLIIDNVPHITSIKDLLPSRGGGNILITTRDNRAIWNHVGSCYEISGLSQVYNKKRIQEAYKTIIKQISTYEKESGKETLYILTIMAYLNTHGFSPDFVAYIAPWQSQWFSYDLGEPIGKERAQKAIQMLMKYGILSPKEYRIHPLCQEVTRTWAQKTFGKPKKETERLYQFMHNIFPYGHKSVELSAVKMLENIYEKTTSESPLRVMAIDHAFALKEHIRDNKSLCKRLLRITN